MGNTIRLGRLFGIEFRLHFTWFIVFFLVTGLLVEPDFDNGIAWLTGIAASLLFFVSVLAHELAHSLVGRAYGVEITGITLFLFGGIAGMKGDVREPGTEFKMAIAGPLCSLALGGIFALILLIPAVQGRIAMMIIWLALMNGMLAVFNLLPGFPLDGGRVFRSVLWSSTGNYLFASRIATRVGQGFGFLLIIGGIVTAVFNPWGLSWFDGIWIALIGWFLANAASAGYRDILRQARPPAPGNNDITDAGYTVINPDSEKKE